MNCFLIEVYVCLKSVRKDGARITMSEINIIENGKRKPLRTSLFTGVRPVGRNGNSGSNRVSVEPMNGRRQQGWRTADPFLRREKP